MMNSPLIKQRGNFTVEFSIVGVFLSLLIVFTGDLIMKLSMKGKLERLSYSIASVIKERTQLFEEEEYSVDDDEAREAYQIVVNSLTRSMGHFDPELFGFDLKVRQRSYYGLGNQMIEVSNWNSASVLGIGLPCPGVTPEVDLLFQTSWGRSATLYQVTLCYQSSNWFGELFGKDYSLVAANAFTLAR